MILPAMGVISEVVPTFAHRRPSSYMAIAVSTAGHRLRRLPHLGPPHVRGRACRRSTPASSASCRCAWPSSRPSRSSPGPRRCTGDRSASDAAALLLRLPLPLRLRRHDRRGGGDPVARRPLARHLLRRRPLPLHHGGRQRHRLPGRGPLLVPQDVRPHVLRAGGLAVGHARCSSGSCSRSCPSSSSATWACPGATTRTPRGFSGSRAVHRRRVPARRGAAADREQPADGAEVGPRAPRQPVGLAQLRVADAVAAAQAQLHRHAEAATSAPTTTP